MKKDYITSGRSKQKLHTRDKILNAANKLINEKGEFTLEEVAVAAELSRATVYRYYSNIDILSAEAVLDMNTKSGETILKELKSNDLLSQCLEIQDYYNNLALLNETAFRKFLSIILTNANEVEYSRGGRRVETLKSSLQNLNINYPPKQITNLINAASVFMGIEALIVTKDVCGLDNESSISTLRWGLEMMIKGFIKEVK